MGASKFIVPLLAAIFACLVAKYFAVFFDVSPPSSGGSSIILTSKRSMNIDGLNFPTDIKILGSMQSLIGGGSRSKWGFRVYAVGIYSNPKLTNHLKNVYLGGGGGSKNSMDANTSSKLSRDFSESHLARTLLLRFHRQVTASDMADALGEALVEKLGKIKSDAFSSFILGIVGKVGGVLEKGADMFITCKGEKLKVTLAEGKHVDRIVMRGLCPAVFQVYLGDKPVSPQAKEGFEKGFASLG
jgi:hypothetical protein